MRHITFFEHDLVSLIEEVGMKIVLLPDVLSLESYCEVHHVFILSTDDFVEIFRCS